VSHQGVSRQGVGRPDAAERAPHEWVDSHCHVHDPKIPDGAAAAIAAAIDSGVGRLVTVGCDRQTSEAAIAVADRHEQVAATVGLHPHDASDGVDTIVDLLDTPGIVAVGEAGLDYHYEYSPRDAQRRAFAAQIQLANERSLPLIIHTREAWDETFDILDAEGTPERTVFHCFTGGADEARRSLERGADISFSGIVTFKNAEGLRAIVRELPADRILVETDATFLAPIPNRGKRNEPAFVADTARTVAELLDMPLETLAVRSTENFFALFTKARRPSTTA